MASSPAPLRGQPRTSGSERIPKQRPELLEAMGETPDPLGRVDKIDPLSDGSQHGEAKKAGSGVIVAGCDAAAVFEAVDEALDAVAQGIEGAIDRVLNVTVLLGRDFGRCTPCTDILADCVA